jgi:hypothetical protein
MKNNNDIIPSELSILTFRKCYYVMSKDFKYDTLVCPKYNNPIKHSITFQIENHMLSYLRKYNK